MLNGIVARQRAGRYFVRFERTDQRREAPGARAAMIEDLEWLGLLGDEAVHDQMELADPHRSALDRLVEDGRPTSPPRRPATGLTHIRPAY